MTWSLVAVVLAASSPSEAAASQAVLDATVTILPVACAGVVAGDERHVLTAGHCVVAPGQQLQVELESGRRVSAVVVTKDGVKDVAVLELAEASGISPLQVAEAPVAVGETVMFAGRRDRNREPVPATVQKVGRCPSLPGVSGALFTTLRGQPGDSGAPLVDLNSEVVGLVHGGAACSIATPLAPFAHEFEGVRQSCMAR